MKTDNALTILGNGTCQLIPDQVTSSALISYQGRHIVFDFGRGVANSLAKIGLRQDEVRNIILSHFHPDHIEDLIPYLHAASWSRTDPRNCDLHIYGPQGLRGQFSRIVGLFGPGELVREHFSVHLHEAPGDVLDIEGLKIRYVSLPAANNHGIKFTINSTTYALTGDAESYEEEEEFLQGVDIAIIDSGHIKEETIIKLAVSSEVPRIFCSHLYHEINPALLTEKAHTLGYKGQIKIAEQMMKFDFNPPS